MLTGSFDTASPRSVTPGVLLLSTLGVMEAAVRLVSSSRGALSGRHLFARRAFICKEGIYLSGLFI